MKKPLLIIFCLFSVFAFYGCPKDDDPVKPEPIDTCQLYKDSILKARFMFRVLDTFVENDTIISGATVNFIADGFGYYEWEWHIGYDTTRRIKKSFNLNFYDVYGYIPIRLIGKRAPRTDCNDDGIDTVNSFIYLKANYESSIFGKYYGTHDDSIPPYIIEFSIEDKQFIRVLNINCGCLDTIHNLHHFVTSRWGNNFLAFENLSIDTENNCYPSKGYAEVSRDLKNISVHYYTCFVDTNRSYFTFKGVRI